MYSVDNYNWTRTSTYTWKLDGPLAGGASAGIILVYNATNAGTATHANGAASIGGLGETSNILLDSSLVDFGDEG